MEQAPDIWDRSERLAWCSPGLVIHPGSAGRIALPLFISVWIGFSNLHAQAPLDRVASYSMALMKADGQMEELVSPKLSLLNWSNPVFGTTDGALFQWTDASGRPSVVMKTYKTRNGRWFEQTRSFSTHRITARDKEGQQFWNPDRGSEPMRPLPDAPVPAKNPVRRLAQMKQQQRRFEVSGDIAGAGGPQNLRPYPTPLYRYGHRPGSDDSSNQNDIIDGVVLGFMQGTGPDVLLMIEIREVDGEPQWYYAVGSIGIFAIDVTLDEKQIWSEPRRTAQNTRPTDLYDGRRLEENESR